MDNLEKLPKDMQLQLRMGAIVMALKKMVINTPELQEEFNKHYNDVIADYKLPDFSEFEQ
ncbi:hypothetical protein [Flavobacterium cerinum]|uniref:Uncharacterized protein n=1 Tax=Flavobacterium cerinum TaxID=2502784 RepID=A0A3S3TSK2_9FLAO|nr:hypothetical protein [Flavobacterium cerinum]RWW91835.1 hypothetical protein EPI11_17490 [Flavobacterium cerinum]